MIALLLSASAYELYGHDWSWQSAPLEQPILVNTASFPASIGTPAEIEQAVEEGLSAWNGVAHLALDVDGTSTAGWASDGDLVLHYSPDAQDGAVIATASSWGWGGTMRDCDVVFWGANDWGPIDWATVEDPWQTDIAEVTTHEIGHCLGFDHSTDSAAVMRPFARGWRGIAQDDVDGLIAMYGVETDADGDGYGADDCDDADASVNPGAAETCDGVDDDCDGAVDAIGSSAVPFGAATSLTASRTDASWLALYEVEADTALVSFTQGLDLPHEMWVSFTVVDITPGQPSTRTVRIERLPAGHGPVESPPMHVALRAGHRYAIGAGAFESARYDFGPLPGAAHGLTPLGGHWSSYAPGLGTGWTPHSPHQPTQVLELVDVDRDGDGTTALCGDCDDLDPAAVDPADCATGPGTPSDPGAEAPEGEGGSGSGCGSSAWVWSLPFTTLGRR